MPLLIACPDCEADNRVDEELKGKTAKCKECGSSFKVGKNAKLVEMNKEEKRKAEEAEKKSKKKSKNDDDDEDDDDLATRKRGRRGDDEDDDDRPKRRRAAPRGHTFDGGGANAKVIAGVGGGIVFVIIAGIIIWQVTSNTPKPKPPENQPAPNSNNNPNDQAKANTPKLSEFDANLEALKGPNPNRNNAHYFATKPVDNDRRVEVARVLEASLTSSDEGVRIDACEALQKWGDKDSIKPVFDFYLAHPERGDKAIETLGKFQDAASAKALVDILKTNPGNKGKIFDALRKVGKAGEGEVASLLTEQDAALQLEACKILKVIGSKDSIAALNAFKEANKPMGKMNPSNAYKEADGAIKTINLRDR